MFENFGKLRDREKKNKSGVGLGLSICHNLIRTHMGGEVNIKSEVEKGSDFIISLSTKSMVQIEELSRIVKAKQEERESHDSDVKSNTNVEILNR